jgi:phage tail sheath gpL-like
VGALASATTLALNTNALRVATPYCRYASATKKQDAAYILAAIFLGAESSRKPTDPAMDVDMTGISLPDTADRLSWTERRTCLNSGVSPIKIMAGERPVLPRVPVTYCRSASGGNVFVDIHKVTGWDNHRDEAKADIEAYAPKKIQEQDEDHPLSTLDIMTSIVLGTAYRLQSKGELTGVKRREAYFLCEVDIDNPGQINILMPSPVPEGNYVKAIKQVCL